MINEKMQSRKENLTQGFTLVELLVVIAIIGILSVIVLSSLSVARGNSRDARRLVDVNQLRNALTLYANDHNGAFPAIAGAHCIGLNDGSTCWSGYNYNGGGSGITGSTALGVALSPYMSTLPADPNSSRSVGDRYLYAVGNESWHCTNPVPAIVGSFIVWEPENTSPNSDRYCGSGSFSCCGPLGCGSNYFCVIRVNE